MRNDVILIKLAIINKMSEVLRNKEVYIFLLSGIIFINVFINQPFISISYVNREFRLVLEAIVLTVLFLFSFKSHKQTLFLLGFVLVVAIVSYMFSGEGFNLYIGRFNKFAFFLLFRNFVEKNANFTNLMVRIWTVLWVLVCCWAIFGTFYYLFYGIDVLVDLDFSSIDSLAHYKYKTSLFGHNFVMRYKDSWILPRNCGVLFEPGQFGFISWLTMFLAYWKIQNLSWKLTVVSICLFSGLVSLSTAFYGVLLFCLPIYFVRFLNKVNLKTLRNFSIFWWSVLFLIILYFWEPFYLFGSARYRVIQFQGAWEVIKMLDLSGYLFGTGFYESYKYMKYTYSSGILALFLIQGGIYALIIITVTFKYISKDKLLLSSLFLFVLVQNPFNYLVFYFLVALIISEAKRC